MKEYTGFARVYDMFMDNVPYDEWAEYLTGLLTEYGICPGRTGAQPRTAVKRAHIEASMTGDRPIVAELGCGTGSMTRRLRDAGYDMIGLDMSGEMLQIAQEKEALRTAAPAGQEAGTDRAGQEAETGRAGQEAETGSAGQKDGTGMDSRAGQEAGTGRAGQKVGTGMDSSTGQEAGTGRAGQADDEILYLLQDMREMELYGTVAAFVSLCDSMNYITDEDDLLQVFRLVCNYLDPNGVFIFDLNTEYYYKNILGEQTICENRETGSFIWENYYDEDSHINQFDLTIYNAEKADVNAPESDAGPAGDAEADDAEADDAEADDAEAGDAEADDAEAGDAEAAETGAGGEQLYRRYEETHYQRAWRLPEVRRLLKKAGLDTAAVYGVGTHEAPARDTERVYIIAHK